MRRFHLRFVQHSAVLAVGIALALPAAAAAQQKPVSTEVLSPKLGFLNPILPSNLLPREMAGGWPLTIRLTSNNELGVGKAFLPAFPEEGDTGFLIYANPDGCFGLSPVSVGVPGPCFNAPIDETYLEFTNDTDQAGVADTFGNFFRHVAQTNAFEDLIPRMLVFDGQTGTNSFVREYGPRVSKPNTTDVLVQRCVTRFGSNDIQQCDEDSDCAGPFGGTCQTIPSEFDGFDWGADDDLPGLVLLADTGPSLVLDQDFNFPPGPKQVRNSAGFLSSVGWELNDSTKHSDVLAHMTVPQGLYQPVVQFDTCVGTPPAVEGGPCGSPPLFRVDGGPEVTSIDNLPAKVTTLRIFAVSGVGPSVLSDLDGNGVVNSKDAVLAGYTLLSAETTLRFRTFSQDEIPGFLVDLGDHNGLVPAPPLPAGGGQITPVPR
jgi:hypothetical protein